MAGRNIGLQVQRYNASYVHLRSDANVLMRPFLVHTTYLPSRSDNLVYGSICDCVGWIRLHFSSLLAKCPRPRLQYRLALRFKGILTFTVRVSGLVYICNGRRHARVSACTCISILIEPDIAQAIHEVILIFVFAIIISTITAYNSVQIQPIETYVMLQCSFGFFLTTMSTLGLRPQLLRHKTALRLLVALKELPKSFKNGKTIRTVDDPPIFAQVTRKVSRELPSSPFATLYV